MKIGYTCRTEKAGFSMRIWWHQLQSSIRFAMLANSHTDDRSFSLCGYLSKRWTFHIICFMNKQTILFYLINAFCSNTANYFSGVGWLRMCTASFFCSGNLCNLRTISKCYKCIRPFFLVYFHCIFIFARYKILGTARAASYHGAIRCSR